MKYYTVEVQELDYLKKTAGLKARDDIEKILSSEKYKEIQIPLNCANREQQKIIGKIKTHWLVKKSLEKKLEELKSGDVLVLQIPIIEHSVFLYMAFRQLKKRGVKIIGLVHDMEYIRISHRKDVSTQMRFRLKFEEKTLEYCDKIIVHNSRMKQYLTKVGFDEDKLIPLEIFDYLIDDFNEMRLQRRKNELGDPIIIAGNLMRQKSEYVYKLPDSVRFNLYGVLYDGVEKENICYKGAFSPEEIPYIMDGSYGLVWDGDSAYTCSGVYGEYLRINNPHKTSLYLASGIPVIIWENAALASFIKKHKSGIVVDSLYSIPDVLKGISKDEYAEMKKNALGISEKLRQGYYTMRAINKALN